MNTFLMDELGFIFCQEQPCLARTPECTIMIHVNVDDILFVGLVGLTSFWKGVFLTKMKEKFSVSHDELKGVGSSITVNRHNIPTQENHGS